MIFTDVKNIHAIIPIYLNGEDCTKIFYKDEEFIIHNSIRTVIKNLALHTCTDLSALRKKFSNDSTLPKRTPIIFQGEHFFIPFSFREARIKGDMISGYINIISIRGFTYFNENILIDLHNDKSITLTKRSDAFNERIYSFFTLYEKMINNK